MGWGFNKMGFETTLFFSNVFDISLILPNVLQEQYILFVIILTIL